ncbi:hypothetical protein BJ875DRAFT_218396 [Amylocarpus encephaloides]|uniref:Uncharacterized protein n=1 Tax=Amylocarpus encephaloides TaxID=45428 RepID=A0A9P8C188_9HELO|nr:hypothetical protein BJ875DRAFT_218396 [Amylocarpus encephaloides]
MITEPFEWDPNVRLEGEGARERNSREDSLAGEPPDIVYGGLYGGPSCTVGLPWALGMLGLSSPPSIYGRRRGSRIEDPNPSELLSPRTATARARTRRRGGRWRSKEVEQRGGGAKRWRSTGSTPAAVAELSRRNGVLTALCGTVRGTVQYLLSPGLKSKPTVANKDDPANQRAGIFSKANQGKSFGPTR